MRRKIYNIVHIYDGNILSIIYKYFMIFVIVASIIPTTTKERLPIFEKIDCFCLVIFIIDYLLRWSTADYKFGVFKFKSFLKYPFRIIDIVDLLSIFALISSVFGLFNDHNIATAMTVFRIVRICRYSKSVRFIFAILQKSKKPLTAVGGLAIGYILISAIIMFNVEPNSFNDFFDAIYWSTVSLTTVGYGDIYPVTLMGRTVAMISSFFGIAVVALPAGIVTAEYLGMIKEDTEGEK